MTDSSDIGGGGSLYQWQKLKQDEGETLSATLGVNRDGTLRHNFSENFLLVPLGYYNWKWNPTRRNYATYEQELLSGILTLGSQKRILAHLPVEAPAL